MKAWLKRLWKRIRLWDPERFPNPFYSPSPSLMDAQVRGSKYEAQIEALAAIATYQVNDNQDGTYTHVFMFGDGTDA